MLARSLLLLALGSLLVAPAHAQDHSITSFAPDSTVRPTRGATPPGFVDLPVWIGVEFAPIPLAVSGWVHGDKHQGSMPWYGVSGSWPMAHRARRWIAFGYSHFVFDGPTFFEFSPISDSTFFGTVLSERVTLDEVEARSGADWLAGRSDRPWAYLGAGLGVAAGWATEGLARPVSHGSLNALIRAGLIVHPTALTRISLGVTGITGYHYSVNNAGLAAMLRVFQAQIAIESCLRLPKRLLPAP